MTDQDDQNETANLLGEITGAWREHLAEEAAKRPVTYLDASTGSIVGQITRYGELSHRESMVTARAKLQARGEWTEDRERQIGPAKYPPLTVAEHLEMLALGTHIAEYYAHPSTVDKAVRAGATWDQIAAATGTTAEAARAAYVEWAEGQHRLHAEIGMGLDDEQYAAAIEAAGGLQAAPAPGDAAKDTRRTAAETVLADYRAAVTSAPLTNPPGREWMFRLASALEDLLAMLGEQADAGDGEDGARP